MFIFSSFAHNIKFTPIHTNIPTIVGIIIEIAVHLILFVSLYIVIHVVEHGQCISENITVHMAVFIVHPLISNISFISTSEFVSTNCPDMVYAISAIGKTISFAGKPSIKAIKITPSNPKILPNGSKKFVQCSKIVIPEILIFASNQMMIPAGNATITALPSTNNVLSNIERTITLPTFGALYGGSSSVNDDGSPFNNVFDNIFETRNVINIPK